MSRNPSAPTGFAVCALLSLSMTSVTITILLLFYSSVIHIPGGSLIIPQMGEIQSKPRNPVDFIESSLDDKAYEKSIFSMSQNDKRVWEYIRAKHLTKPSTKRYNLSSNLRTHPNECSQTIYRLFNQKNGIFIEAGAFDGESASNSLYLEERGWQGILIECNPVVMEQLRSKNRKAWIANVCLSLTEKPQMLNFSTPVEWPASAKLGKPLNAKQIKAVGIDWMTNKTWLEYQLPTFPLYSIIRAIGTFKQIDLLSLDVEGVEVQILKHFPFDKIFVKVLFIEVFSYSSGQREDLKKFLWDKGYVLAKVLENDHLYVHRKSGLNLENLKPRKLRNKKAFKNKI